MIKPQFPAPIAVGALQVSAVPVLEVEDAASPVGALGAAVQAPGPLLPPQDGRSNNWGRIKASSVKGNSFFLRPPAATRQMLRSAIPIAGSGTGEKTLARRSIAFAGGVVVIVSVVWAPAPVGVTGFIEKLVALQTGSGEPVPVTLHVRLTGRLYPLSAVRVTVEVPEVPGFTAAGVVAEIKKPLTLNCTVVTCTSVPDVPVTITV